MDCVSEINIIMNENECRILLVDNDCIIPVLSTVPLLIHVDPK